MINNNTMLVALAQAAVIFEARMRQNLEPGKYPKAIPDSIVIDSPQAFSNGFYVDVIVGNEDAKMTRAFEYGSGERATRQPPAPYPITPKNATLLHFLWKYPSPLGRKYLVPGDEEVFFSRVMHPGIAPRPFVRPSIDETREQIRQKLGQGFRAMIMTGVPAVTIIEVK